MCGCDALSSPRVRKELLWKFLIFKSAVNLEHSGKVFVSGTSERMACVKTLAR